MDIEAITGSTLEDLKEAYVILEKDYSLPNFDALNLFFQIEKIADLETDFLIKEVRKVISEKLSFYLKFTELILNPVNVPMFIFSIIKSLNMKDKELLIDVYNQLSKMEVETFRLDLDFNPAREARFIKESFCLWGKIKDQLLKIFDSVEQNWENDLVKDKKGYFG